MNQVDGGRVDSRRPALLRKAAAAALLLCTGVALSAQVAQAQTAPGPSLSAWSSTTSLPEARSRGGATYANGYLYMVGGVNAAGDTINTSYYAPVNANGTVGSWTTTTPLPGNRRTVQPVAYNGFVYFVGGNDGANFHNEVYVAPLNANGTIGTWTATTPLPGTQTSHATVASNGYLYVIGGNTGPSCTNVVRFAPINANGTLGAWGTTSTLPAARCGNVGAAVVANGYLYTAGGYDNSNVTSGVYYARLNANGTLGAWAVNPTSLPTAREYHGIKTMNGYLYAIGGQAGLAGSVTTSVEVARLNADGSVGTWSATASLPGPRGEVATEMVNGYLYAIGGGTLMSGGNPQTSVYYTSANTTVDATPPTVSVGSLGSTVSGTVTVTATAADNIGVVGVQFFVDGNELGAEDTSSPYSVSWNTNTVNNGTHAVTAVARDAAGNQTTSAPVNVTVTNALAGPILAYGMNENAGATTADASGGANTATLTSTTWTAAGRYDAGLVFNGTTSRARANANVTLGTAFTMEAWVLNPANNGYETIMSVGSNRDLYLESGNLTFWTGGSDVSFGTLPTNSWQHVAITYDGTSLRAYVNGNQLGGSINVGALTAQTNVFQLGAYPYNGGNVDYLSGTIDEARVYNRVLSAGQLATDSTTPIDPPAPDTTPPVLSGGQPSGTLPGNTTQATLQVTSNEAATCRYSLTPGTNFNSMANTFTTTGGTTHTTQVTGLTSGTTYTFYVRCRDAANNANTSDLTISFSTAALDGTPPTVSVGSLGATVSGTVTVTATAADNVGVAGVQFFVDGNVLGAEDTSSPYSVSWNTNGVPNGNHSITARARDASGNQTTSAPVTTNVANTLAGPILAYGLNENAGATTADDSGSANNATLTSTTWTDPARYGSGLVLNGTTSRATANANITLGPSFTMEAWVLNPTNAPYETIMSVGSNRDLYLENGNLTFWTGGADVSFGALPTNSWQHVAITYDGTSLRAYLNGNQLGATATVALTAQTNVFQLGAYPYNGGNVDYLSGNLDEVRVYNRALTPAQLATDIATPI